MKRQAFFILIIFTAGALVTGCAEKTKEAKEAGEVKVSRPAGPREFLIADFNSGQKPNNIGGNFGAWDKDPKDPTQGCRDAFDSNNRYGQKGFSIKLDYDVDSKNPAYNGFWMELRGFDASGYDSVSFWVKGDRSAGYAAAFKIEFKNIKNEVGAYYVTNVTDSWQNMIIPLKKIRGITDFSGLREFVIVFEDKIASKKDGAIYIDDIAFMRNG